MCKFGGGIEHRVQCFFLVCFFVCFQKEELLQDIHKRAATNNHERSLQGKYDLICQNAVREEGHEVVGRASGVDDDTHQR